MHFRHSEKNQDKQCFIVCNWAGKFLCPLLPWQRENTFLFCWYLGQGWWAQMQCLRELHFFPPERNIFVDPPIPLQLVITGRWGDCSTNELHPRGRNYYVQSIKGVKLTWLWNYQSVFLLLAKHMRNKSLRKLQVESWRTRDWLDSDHHQPWWLSIKQSRLCKLHLQSSAAQLFSLQ